MEKMGKVRSLPNQGGDKLTFTATPLTGKLCPVGAAMFSEKAWQQITAHFGLSPRELQYVRGVFDDQTEFAIAVDLGISPQTAHVYSKRLHRKLAVNDRVNLVLRIVDEYLALTAAPGSTMPPICARRAADRCPMHK
jgi:DNA-binding CsgD family transcriptional regulator